MEKAMIHIYSGDGVGKTTASVGLAVRAAGNDKKVIFCQFMKGSPSGEIEILRQIPQIHVIRNDIDFGFSPTFSKEIQERITELHNNSLSIVKKMLKENDIDLLIFDEVNSAYELNLIDRTMVDKIIFEKDSDLEIVLTGRNPTEKFISIADYHSDIKCIKHPFNKGISARKGIEY